MQGNEEVWILSQLFTCPEIPARCVGRRRMPQTIDRCNFVTHIPGDSKFQLRWSFHKGNVVARTSRSLLARHVIDIHGEPLTSEIAILNHGLRQGLKSPRFGPKSQIMRREAALATVLFRQFWPLIALTAALFGVSPVLAQVPGENALFSGVPTTDSGLLAPAPNALSNVFAPGGVLAPPSLSTTPDLSIATAHVSPRAAVPGTAGHTVLTLGARFGEDAAPITGGLDWRVFSAKPDANGKFKLIKEDKSAAPILNLPPGSYIVHVGFGLATAVRPITLRAQTALETFDLPAGGLRIEGRVGDARIPAGQISFEVYKGSQFDGGNERPIVEHVTSGSVVVVPEGTYYIVSNYGNANSVVRSDIRVQAGKMTDVTVTHRAAAITLKLVTQAGGEALANTSWSVITPGGDVIKESIGAFPRVILAEGDYRAIARNDGKIYEREFKVATGVDGDVELLAK